jgi:hypothetical protein
MDTPTTPWPPIDRRAGRGLLWIGIALAAAAIGLMFLQIRLKILIVPWYLPGLTTIGALLVIWSLTRRVGIVRIVVLVLLVALAGFEWFAIGVASRLPKYTGPAQAGKKLPSFYTTLADGSALTNSNLRDGKQRVMTFFRGRW